MKINQELEVRWLKNSGSQLAVQHLLVRGTLVEFDAVLQSQMAEELEDLLCRLFHTAKGVLVRPMNNGRSGTAECCACNLFTAMAGATPSS